MSRSGIVDRVSSLGDRARQRMTHGRVERLGRDNDRLRGEVAMLRDDLQEERGALREALKTLGEGRAEAPSERRRRRPHVVRTVAIAAAAYVLGTRAGRERYERIVARVRAMGEAVRRPASDDEGWREPDVRAVRSLDRGRGGSLGNAG